MERLLILTIQVHRKKSEQFRHFWRCYVVTIFCRWHHFRRFWWRHSDFKNVGIVLNFFMPTFIVKMDNRANFYKNRNGGSLFSGIFLCYFILLGYGTMGGATALFEVTWHHTRNVFSTFFSPKVRKTNFHNISNRFLIEIQWKYEKNRLTKSAVVDPLHCPIPH